MWRETLVGQSPAMLELKHRITEFARVEATVLVCGETGKSSCSCLHAASPARYLRRRQRRRAAARAAGERFPGPPAAPSSSVPIEEGLLEARAAAPFLDRCDVSAARAGGCCSSGFQYRPLSRYSEVHSEVRSSLPTDLHALYR
jgi:hypothetical protein